jgi:hypothetical protein
VWADHVPLMKRTAPGPVPQAAAASSSAATISARSAMPR